MFDREDLLDARPARPRGGGLPSWRSGRAREPEPVADAGGSLTSQRRDALFRRTLAAADCVALMLALTTTTEVFSSLRLLAPAVAALPLTVLAAKLLGLYDRDQALLRKTTLEEIPRLFQLATLCSLVLWLVHDLVIAGPFTRGAALLLWGSLALMIPTARVVARAASLRLTLPERCMVISDQVTRRALDKRLDRGSGINTEIVDFLRTDRPGMPTRDVLGSSGVDGI